MLSANYAPPLESAKDLENNTDVILCNRYPGSPPKKPTTMYCLEIYLAKYVYLYRAATARLTLCELLVYALGKYDYNLCLLVWKGVVQIICKWIRLTFCWLRPGEDQRPATGDRFR